MRLALIAATMALSAVASVRAAELSVPCKESPKIVGACFTVHGRLSIWNGTTGVRIWRIGTKRILGIFDGSGEAESESVIPSAVEKLLKADSLRTDVYGDYEVCPLDREHQGRMQSVCIQRASRLVVGKRN